MRGVLNISEAFSLALHSAALVAASSGGRETAKSMAEAMGASENHLSKVLRRMVREGILVSARGPGGGFSLGKPGGEITLMEIYQCVEGPFRPVECIAPTPVCGGGGCVFGGLLEKASAEFREYLENTTVEDIKRWLGKGERHEKKDRGDR
ncbi:MAG: Rrf2 family transcriptional regulator [Actinobacteria bacterium]|nr:Rrf2 family transcriptional regulator [Actinomycetota bacterium]